MQVSVRGSTSDWRNTEKGAFAAQPWLQPGSAPDCGVVVTNPPYGLRVQGKSPLRSLYQTIGHRVERLGSSWRTAILAHDVRLARRTGLALEPAFTTRHGGLSVTAMTTPAAADAS